MLHHDGVLHEKLRLPLGISYFTTFCTLDTLFRFVDTIFVSMRMQVRFLAPFIRSKRPVAVAILQRLSNGPMDLNFTVPYVMNNRYHCAKNEGLVTTNRGMPTKETDI